MADLLHKCVVTIPILSNVAEDYITNTWYFDTDDGNTEGDAIGGEKALLTAFYQAIDGELFPSTVGSPANIKVYNMRDAQPRVPIHDGDINLAPGAGTPLPSEVALVLSFSAANVSGVARARRRGRVYLGPVQAPAMVTPNYQSRPNTALLTNITAAAEAMMAGYNQVIGSTKWAVYSPTTDLTSSLDDSFNDVVSGWMDDSWDTQRRRGAAPTTRSVFP